MKKNILLLIITSLLFSGCTGLDEIDIQGIKKYSIKSLKDNELKAVVTLKVNNPTWYPITLKDLELRTQINGRYIGKVYLDEKIKIKAKRESEVEIPVTLKISNIMATAFVMLNMKNAEQLIIEIDGDVTARSYLFTKKVEVNESFNIGELKL